MERHAAAAHPLVRASSVVLLVAFVVLGVLAARDDGEQLREWDVSLQRRVEEARTPTLTRVMRHLTNLGGSQMMVAGGAVVVGLAWRRSRVLAVVVLVSLLARPLLETALKLAVDRPRPDLEPLVRARGASFPSGHAFAAISLWGMLPPVAALYTRRSVYWWASIALAAVLVAGIGFSRIYLGAHWTTDVLASYLLGVFYLLALGRLFVWLDARDAATQG